MPRSSEDVVRSRVRSAIKKHGTPAVCRALRISRYACLVIASEGRAHDGTFALVRENLGALDALDEP